MIRAMSKHLVMDRDFDIQGRRDTLRAAAAETQLRIAELAGDSSPMEFIRQLKFDALGCDPLDPSRRLNLVEQLNQSFTYLASFNAAEVLFSKHPRVKSLTLSLGTRAGWDIESTDNGGLVAEVFAAETPKNNQKLANDNAKVAGSRVKHRYVLFMCPGCDAGLYRSQRDPTGVVVWSLGCEL